MKKLPFTLNSSEARRYLESLGFDPLSFYQGKKYIYPLISTMANGGLGIKWNVFDYSTFDKKEYFHDEKESTLEIFKEKVSQYIDYKTKETTT